MCLLDMYEGGIDEDNILSKSLLTGERKMFLCKAQGHLLSGEVYQ